MFLEQQISILWRFSTAWYDSLGTVQNGTAQFAFPMQFSTALEWTGLFTCRYSCAASTAVTPEKLFHSASLHHALAGSAPRLSTRGTSVLPQQTTKQPFLVVKKRCTNSKQLRSILRRLCWFKSSGSVVSRAASSMTQAVTIFSPANQWSAEFTRDVLVTVRLVSASDVTPTDRWLNVWCIMAHLSGNTSGVSKSSSDWLNYTGFPGDVCRVL